LADDNNDGVEDHLPGHREEEDGSKVLILLFIGNSGLILTVWICYRLLYNG